ncbi:SDR family oxidoreductase [soil metagenome]
MRILILGGSQFVGRHITEALAADHEVWLANRGRTSTDLFGAAGRLDVDRSDPSAGGDLSALAEQAFDAVVDVSAYVPRQVREVAEVLGDDFTGRYLLISTVSVYDPEGAAADVTETATVVPAVRDTEGVTGKTYGGLKVACEQEAADAFGDRLTVVRPGIVAGPHDPTDRLTWWVRHLGDSTGMPLPDLRDQPVQAVDARDLAGFCRGLLEHGTSGAFDATGASMPLAQLVEEVVAVVGAAWAGGSTGPTWVPREAWGEVPLPPMVLDGGDLDGDRAHGALFRRDSTAAVAAGLERRPLRETVTDLLTWDIQRGQPPLQVGPTTEQLSLVGTA